MPAVKVEIESSQTRYVSGESKRTGKRYAFSTQEGFVHIPGNKYPQKIEFVIPDEMDGKGYPPGIYRLADDSIYVDRNNKLAINVRLESARAQTAAA